MRRSTDPGPEKVEVSGGNVFADLDVPDPEEMLAKAELVRRIGEILTERKATQAQAAALLGIDQPEVAALLRGRLGVFSAERLFRFLNALGRDVEIVVRPTPAAGDRASTRVLQA